MAEMTYAKGGNNPGSAHNPSMELMTPEKMQYREAVGGVVDKLVELAKINAAYSQKLSGSVQARWGESLEENKYEMVKELIQEYRDLFEQISGVEDEYKVDLAMPRNPGDIAADIDGAVIFGDRTAQTVLQNFTQTFRQYLGQEIANVVGMVAKQAGSVEEEVEMYQELGRSLAEKYDVKKDVTSIRDQNTAVGYISDIITTDATNKIREKIEFGEDSLDQLVMREAA